MSQQALCFVVVVKLKKNYKMDVSVVWFEMRLHPEMLILKRTLSYPILSVASKRRIILLLTCLVCVSYQLYNASAKEMIKNSRTINILISKTVPQSIHS